MRGKSISALGGIAILFVAGCSSPRVNTTMLAWSDIARMTDLMAEDLSNSPRIAHRDASSPPWVWSMDRVRNLSEHPMPDAEKWGAMARFRTLLTESRFGRERQIAFILPPSEWQRYASDMFDADAARLAPTHALRAEFRSDTASSVRARSDAYLCAFQLIDLADGEILWESAYETKFSVTRSDLD